MGARARLIDWSYFKRNNLGGFPKDNEIGFFQEFCWKTISFVHTILGFDWSGWIVLIKSEILIKVGMVWPVRSDKWKAPLESRTHKSKTVYLNLFKGRDRFYRFFFFSGGIEKQTKDKPIVFDPYRSSHNSKVRYWLLLECFLLLLLHNSHHCCFGLPSYRCRCTLDVHFSKVL